MEDDFSIFQTNDFLPFRTKNHQTVLKFSSIFNSISYAMHNLHLSNAASNALAKVCVTLKNATTGIWCAQGLMIKVQVYIHTNYKIWHNQTAKEHLL